MPAHLLAVLTLANPALLWGAAACAIPIAIHLFMRAKPRRQSFPAMQLLMAVKTGSVREHRLRNLLLLIVRMLAIVLLVAALARPVSRGSWLAARSRGPTAAAFVMDDSASMNQRYAGQSRLAKGRAWITQLVNDSIRFPTGSSFAVLSCGYAPGPERLIDAPGEALRGLSAATDEAHDRSLGAAIDRAASLLSGAKAGRRELYVATDNTQAAWADAAAGRWAGLTDTAVFILDAGDAEKENARLVNLKLPGAVIPPRSPVRVSCTIQSGERAMHSHVDALVDGMVVARSEPVAIQPNQSLDVSITLPALAPGVHAAELRLPGPDANLVDDSLFFMLEARTPPSVLVISSTNESADELEAQRVAALLAPPTMAEDRRPFQVSVRSSGASTSLQPGDAGSIIWVGDPPNNSSRHEELAEFVKHGGRLILLPPSVMGGNAPRDSLLPGRWRQIESLTRPLSMRWVQLSADSQSTLPFDLSFARRDGVDSLASRQISQRADLTPNASAIRLAEFADGRPAILARSHGSGVVVQLAFRLDPDWGDLGSRAAAAMVLFHAMVGNTGGASARALQRRCGETVELDCGGSANAEVLVTQDRGKRDELPQEKRRLSAGGRLAIRANSAGVQTVHDSAARRILAGVAVNLREAETQSDRATDEHIRAAFAPGAAVLISDPATLETPTTAVAGDREWDGYAFIALLALLAAEILFANRFYRTR